MTDPKMQWVARKSGATPADVIAVWACLLEHASNVTQCNDNETRGSVNGFDKESFEIVLGLDNGKITEIIAAMEEKEMIADGMITNWEKRQPKREDSSTERVRKHRAKKKAEEECNENSDNETQCNETERLDKIRLDKNKEKDISLSDDNDNGKADGKRKNGYPERFENLWEFARGQYGKINNPVGNKSEAFDSFKKRKPSDEDLKSWCVSLRAQVEAKRKAIDAGGDPANLKHFCRWINKACWDDDPDPPPRPTGPKPNGTEVPHQSENPKQEFKPGMH